MKQTESTRSGGSSSPVLREQASFVTANGQGLFGPATSDSAFIAPIVQPKLSVSQPGDMFEQEADAAADHIMRMPMPSAGGSPPASNSDDPPGNGPLAPIMPKCDACEEEEKQEQPDVQAKALPGGLTNWLPVMRAPKEDEEERPNLLQAKPMAGLTHLMLKCSHCEAEEREHDTVQRKPASESSGNSGFSLESYLQRSSSSGEAMDRGTRSFMESRFGADFSSVRIHTGAQPQQASDSIRARAFTHGQDIHFNAGEYQPQTDGGRWLLAHELTHTLQQRSGQVQPRLMRKEEPDEPAYYEKQMGGKEAYAEAKALNLESWYTGYKFFNLFQEEAIYPGSQPNAYATRVYELQGELYDLIKDEKKYSKNLITGVLEPDFTTSPTLNLLLGLASVYASDQSNNFGFKPDLLMRLNRLTSSIDKKAPPLVSRLFRGLPQLTMVNSSKNFVIEKGDRGLFVIRIQMALLKLNYSLGSDFSVPKGKTEKDVTGIFGEDTRKAVQQFQMDSGMEGKDIDGVVGQITLRLLDQRLEKYVKTSHSYAEANTIGVMVPVTEADIPSDPSKAEAIKHDMLLRTIMATMPLSKIEAENLLKSNWHWINYRDVTIGDVTKGYIINGIDKGSYEKIMGKPKDGSGGVTAEHLSEQIIDQALELQTTTDLYRLQNEVKALEKERDGLQLVMSMSEGSPPAILQEQLVAVNKKLNEKIEARDRELHRLGYKNIDEYTDKNEHFVKTFLQYAAMIAFQMLGRNEAKASAEYQHYENLDEIKKLKVAIDKLNQYYATAETYLMQGVSYKETNGENINKYKTRFDYIREYETCDDMGCDGSALEAELQSTWQASVKEKSTTNPYFAKLFDEEATAFKYLKDQSGNFPILGNPNFNVRDNGPGYAKKTNESLREDVREIIGTRTSDDGVLHNIAATRERIRGDVELLWEMPPVIAQAKAELGIIDGTVLDNIITDAHKAHQDKGFWTTIFKAALGIGLGLLALVSGPVGWIALGASIAYGALDAYQTFQEIKMKREASGTAIDEEAMALMHDKPSYFWFVVSLVGVGLDGAQALKVIRAVKTGVELSKGVQGAIDAQIASSKLEQAALKAGSKEAVDIGRRIERLEKALTEIDWVHYAEHSQILKVLKDSPFAVRFMADALKEPGLAKAFTKLAKLGLSEDLMKTVVGMYAGVGKKALGELPEVMRLIESGKMAGNPKLMQTVLTDLKVQKALLDSGDAGKIAKEFGKWEAISGSKTLSFAEHLKQSGMNTFFQKGVVLTERFGPEFAQMSNLMKNRYILQEMEPMLVAALNNKRLPPSVQRSLEVALQRDVLGLTNDLGIAQERMTKELAALGGTFQFQSEYLSVVSLVQSTRSRKLLWEAAVQLPGHADYLKLVEELALTNPKVKTVMDDLIKIGPLTDKSTLERLVAEDGLRRALADNPLAVLALKKCASPCFPPNATTEQITRLTKLLVGRSNDEMARVNNLIYQNRSTAQTLETAVKSLETNFDEAIKTAKGAEVIFPKGLAVTDEIKSLAQTVVALGLPSAQVNNIIKNVLAKGGAVNSRVENLLIDLKKVLELNNNVKFNNLNVLLTGLENADPGTFKTAEFLIDEIARHAKPSDLEKALFTYPGLQKTDKLLTTFKLGEIQTLIQANRDRTGFINTLYALTQKVDGTNAQWMELMQKAGSGGKSDMQRLMIILESQPGRLTYQQAIDAIARSKSFADDVAAAMADTEHGYAKIAKRVWGEGADVADAGAITVSAELQKGMQSAGKKAYKLVVKEGRGISLANTVATGGKVDYSRWKVLKSVIENTNISQSIKNNIIGELWALVHVRSLEQQGYRVIREVKLTDGKVIAKVDAVAIQGDKMIVLEFKSLAGELTENQDIIYPMLKDARIKMLSFLENAEVDTFFATNRNNVIYELMAETSLVPK